jgi:hypothetical protein
MRSTIHHALCEAHDTASTAIPPFFVIYSAALKPQTQIQNGVRARACGSETAAESGAACGQLSVVGDAEVGIRNEVKAATPMTLMPLAAHDPSSTPSLSHIAQRWVRLNLADSESWTFHKSN